MGILRKLREWRENEDGTLEGPSLKTEKGFTETVPDDPDAIPNRDWVGENTDGNAEGWSEDENSPHTAENLDGESVSFVLADTYDEIRVKADCINNRNSATQIDFRAFSNGTSAGAYDIIQADGSISTGNTYLEQVARINDNGRSIVTIEFPGRSEDGRHSIDVTYASSSNIEDDAIGARGSSISDIDEIEFDILGEADIRVEIYGRDY